MKYHYQPGTDGCDNTFDIMEGDELLVSVRYWERKEGAEADAKLITDALNAYDNSRHHSRRAILNSSKRNYR
jgi:hypothetical protein